MKRISLQRTIILGLTGCVFIASCWVWDSSNSITEIETLPNRGLQNVPHVVVQSDINETVLEDFERISEERCSLSSVMDGTDLCPCRPTNMKGRMKIDMDKALNYTWREVDAISADVEYGGTWSPSDCVPRQRMLIIIPYRDREAHLKAILAHMHPILQRQQLAYRILVVEQNEPAIFNKAALMNAAVREASLKWKDQADCITFQDVDTLMEDDRNLIRCGESPVHYTVATDREGYKVYEHRMFGGATSFTPQQFRKVNGFSNNFFGWGAEDINMFYRIVEAGFDKTTPTVLLGRYTTMKHLRPESNARNCHNSKLMLKPTLKEGLSTVKYQVLQYEEYPSYTWLKINLNVTGLPYPDIHKKAAVFAISKGSCKNLEEIGAVVKKTIDACLQKCEEMEKCGTVFANLKKKKFNCSFRKGFCAEHEMNAVTSYTKRTGYQCKTRQQIK